MPWDAQSKNHMNGVPCFLFLGLMAYFKKMPQIQDWCGSNCWNFHPSQEQWSHGITAQSHWSADTLINLEKYRTPLYGLLVSRLYEVVDNDNDNVLCADFDAELPWISLYALQRVRSAVKIHCIIATEWAFQHLRHALISVWDFILVPVVLNTHPLVLYIKFLWICSENRASNLHHLFSMDIPTAPRTLFCQFFKYVCQNN